MSYYDFFQNRKCEYFPCHKNANRETFSCIMCYCPLYALGDRCGGSFTYTRDGIKDCSACLKPHKRENYDLICKELNAIMEMVKKTGANSETP